MNHRSLGILAGLVLLILPAAQARAGDRIVLPGLVPPIVAHLTPLGKVAATNHLRLAISLPLRNQNGLNALMQQMYDPASPNYRHYLTPPEFTAKFGPTEAEYQQVVDFATTNGLQLMHIFENRQLVDVSGTVADIDKTFQITLNNYQHPTENRVFFAPNTAPSVAPGVPILSVSGLNNYVLPHPALRKPAGP